MTFLLVELAGGEQNWHLLLYQPGPQYSTIFNYTTDYNLDIYSLSESLTGSVPGGNGLNPDIPSGNGLNPVGGAVSIPHLLDVLGANNTWPGLPIALGYGLILLFCLCTTLLAGASV